MKLRRFVVYFLILVPTFYFLAHLDALGFTYRNNFTTILDVVVAALIVSAAIVFGKTILLSIMSKGR